MTVFPEDQIGAERAQTILVRVKEQLLQLPQDRASWAPARVCRVFARLHPCRMSGGRV